MDSNATLRRPLNHNLYFMTILSISYSRQGSKTLWDLYDYIGKLDALTADHKFKIKFIFFALSPPSIRDTHS